MASMENVIRGLEYHLKELSVGKTCFGCPYCGDNPCEIHLISDAIELLKKLKEDNVRLDRENQKLIEQMAQQPQDDANDDDDYDPCYECRGLGDDYIINDDGELESWCDKCGVNPDRMKDDE